MEYFAQVQGSGDREQGSVPLTFHKKPALVAYVTCGDPNLATTRELILSAIEAGADVVSAPRMGGRAGRAPALHE